MREYETRGSDRRREGKTGGALFLHARMLKPRRSRDRFRRCAATAATPCTTCYAQTCIMLQSTTILSY
eukprot:3253099-Pyramimonas_sp.AAC.1